MRKGDIIFYTYSGETVPHHVVIYLGGDRILEALEDGDRPRGELLLERDHGRRWAERDGTYDAIFAAVNPT